jgi:hypothetical protein
MNQFERSESVNAINHIEAIVVANRVEQPIETGAFSEYVFGNFFASNVVGRSVKFPIVDFWLMFQQGFDGAFCEDVIFAISVHDFDSRKDCHC